MSNIKLEEKLFQMLLVLVKYYMDLFDPREKRIKVLPTRYDYLSFTFDLLFRYGGFQFGYWAEQLGDGRAHLLGEYINSREATLLIQKIRLLYFLKLNNILSFIRRTNTEKSLHITLQKLIHEY